MWLWRAGWVNSLLAINVERRLCERATDLTQSSFNVCSPADKRGGIAMAWRGWDSVLEVAMGSSGLESFLLPVDPCFPCYQLPNIHGGAIADCFCWPS
jgi:hypothetical protein